MTQDIETLAGSEGAVEFLPVEASDDVTWPDWESTRKAVWSKPEPAEYRCEIRLCGEPEGGYSVYAPELPGVVTEGETAEEAMRNVAEALQGTLRTYLDDDQPIPWKKDAEPLQQGETPCWIVVHV
ncbi:MAG: type II toxin-antitoxin system HicB family antitoxin [Phycisphaerales bacterium]|nr:MAG: type II toxin-antitoxin system HicB family antitoxin [Phycisphaerales bacterium]